MAILGVFGGPFPSRDPLPGSLRYIVKPVNRAPEFMPRARDVEGLDANAPLVSGNSDLGFV